MLFIAIARDGTDELALSRRAAVRAKHLEGIAPLIEAGTVQLGGAMLNDAGEMIGSMLLIEASDLGTVRAMLERDVYTTAGVWQSFEIMPFRIAVTAKEVTYA